MKTPIKLAILEESEEEAVMERDEFISGKEYFAK